MAKASVQCDTKPLRTLCRTCHCLATHKKSTVASPGPFLSQDTKFSPSSSVRFLQHPWPPRGQLLASKCRHSSINCSQPMASSPCLCLNNVHLIHQKILAPDLQESLPSPVDGLQDFLPGHLLNLKQPDRETLCLTRTFSQNRHTCSQFRQPRSPFLIPLPICNSGCL